MIIQEKNNMGDGTIQKSNNIRGLYKKRTKKKI